MTYKQRRCKEFIKLEIPSQGLEGYFRDSGFDQNTVRDSGKRKLYILTDKGTLQLPGKRDSPNFKDGIRHFFCLYVGNREIIDCAWNKFL